MKLTYWSWLVGVSVIGATAVTSSIAYAQQTQLEQQINPIDCIYTTTQNGVASTTATNCENQPVPMITSVIVNAGRPILRGSFSAAQTTLLRVWVNGQWYTSGIDSRLTADGDVWTLNLSGMAQPLAEGVYAIIVSIETNEGLVIRNAQAVIFSVDYMGDEGVSSVGGSPSRWPYIAPSTSDRFRPSFAIPMLSPPIAVTSDNTDLQGNVRQPTSFNIVDSSAGEARKDAYDKDTHALLVCIIVLLSVVTLVASIISHRQRGI